MSVRFIVSLLSIVLSLPLVSQNGDAVLMKVGKTDVRVSEFKYIYEKNNGNNADYSDKNLSEYLDLYTKFKLKVEKAKELKLDTIGALMSELDGYRKQLASSYLIDKEVTDFLLHELYTRTKEDVMFSHIFIPVQEGSPKAVIDEAKNKLMTVKTKISSGMSFEDAAKEYSQDKTTASKGGNMGFFTAKLPSGFYALESAIYTLQPGQVSDVVESRIGYHLVRVLEKRPARGLMEVAHILVDAGKKSLADSLYNELEKGKDFDMLALNYSTDKTTNKNGGKLPPFGINTFDKTFEDAAFAISKDGTFSKPVLTKSGWHIIKRLSKTPMDTYEVFVRKMKGQINKDQRFDIAKIKLISDIKKAAGFKEDKNELQRFTAGLNEEFYSYKWSPEQVENNKVLFSLGGSNIYKVSDFANYCKKNTKTRLKYDKSKPLVETVEELYKEYVNESAMAFEEKSLETKYPDFKSLMREYEEGILLFEATKINVWDKANQDTIGLKNFYEQHRSNYKWGEKVAISDITITGVDMKLAEKIHSFIMKNDKVKAEKKFNKKSKVIQFNDGEYEKGSKDLAGLDWKVGAVSPLFQDATKTAYTFKKINKFIPPKEKTLSEARGYVVADYQDFLEKEWLNTLSKEFNVVIYKDVLNTLKK